MIRRVIIAGSRNFHDDCLFAEVVDEYLSQFPREDGVIIMSGHCRGTDMLAEQYAAEHGLEVEIYPADWTLGRKASPLRNKAMVEKADAVLAFYDGGRGTESLIGYAEKRGIPAMICRIGT